MWFSEATEILSLEEPMYNQANHQGLLESVQNVIYIKHYGMKWGHCSLYHCWRDRNKSAMCSSVGIWTKLTFAKSPGMVLLPCMAKRASKKSMFLTFISILTFINLSPSRTHWLQPKICVTRFLLLSSPSSLLGFRVLFNFFFFGSAKTQASGFIHVREVLQHWATSPLKPTKL